jgi:molybdate/tungstate transport system ATP-binding protein
MIKLENINVKFKNFELKNISLDIQKGEYHVLLGASGSGKTLILNCIAGFQKINSGKIFYKDKDISKTNPNKRKVSYLFQDLALFPHLNVYKNLEYPLKIKKIEKKQREKIIEKYLKFTEIEHLKDRNIEKLSGGEKQRLAIARCLITENDLLLLDEPFSAIDTQLVLELKKLLKKISSMDITVIHVTHNFEEAVNMANKISVIDNGKIIQSGDIESLFKTPKSKFVAMFSGHKNYYPCQETIQIEKSNYAIIKKEKNNLNSDHINNYLNPENSKIDLTKYLLIEINSTYTPSINNGIIIDNKNIILSKSKIISSARNNFNAIVTNIFPNQNSYDIEVYCGVNLWISLTKQSFIELNIKLEDEFFISFKASAVQIV